MGKINFLRNIILFFPYFAGSVTDEDCQPEIHTCLSEVQWVTAKSSISTYKHQHMHIKVIIIHKVT